MTAPVSGGAAAYAGLTDEQRLAKQKAAHELGAKALKEQATQLGLAKTKGRKGEKSGLEDGAAVAFGGAWRFSVHMHMEGRRERERGMYKY